MHQSGAFLCKDVVSEIMRYPHITGGFKGAVLCIETTGLDLQKDKEFLTQPFA